MNALSLLHGHQDYLHSSHMLPIVDHQTPEQSNGMYGYKCINYIHTYVTQVKEYMQCTHTPIHAPIFTSILVSVLYS